MANLRSKLVLLIILFFFLLSEVGRAAAADSLKYVNAANFELIGKGFTDGQNSYQRLPSSLQGKTRPPVWSLSQNCSGPAIRFRTNSPVIAAKWEVTGDVVMNHFAPSGIKGLDLYCLKNGKWQFVNSARPAGKITTTVIIDNMVESILFPHMYFD